ncbi:MAG: Glycosyl transferase family 9 [Candidatus Uhrbacteria bacterium GW2011_GWF2_39_13]|uniref:Glycosyl transferase family 9 n=1 Tax=Candidatus Uhrbacteria bacterium GW2011_GWF2_39_13 TaxID=1618995 RepID=A0A0G0MII9_9BACT|nr:MAG: Glycosyl transferase family 9 [Candidatus Uhrbacteria bacterium GW2011_GWF2_39_13]
MNLGIIRKIDEYLGPLVCRFFYWLEQLSHPSRKRNIIENLTPKKILIIKFFGLGTILLTSPALRILKEKYHDAEITILTTTSNVTVCSMLPTLDKVLDINIKNPASFLISYLKLLNSFRKEHYDLIIDLEFLTNFSSLTTILCMFLGKSRVSIGFNSPQQWRNRIYNYTVSFDHSRHISKIFMKLVSILFDEKIRDDIDFNTERKVFIENADKKYFDKLLKKEDALKKCRHIVCVNINAGFLCLHRRWPEEYYREILEKLLKIQDMGIVLIGGKEDENYVSGLYRKIPSNPRLVNVCGMNTIKELMGLFVKSNLLITNDSGPLHIAYLIGLPTISFFGPETPFLYGPIGHEHHIFYEDIYCSPCLNIYNSKFSKCKNNICLRNITPEKVLKVLKEKYHYCL